MKPLPSGLNLIGIHGHAGVGKDTVADYIREQFVDVYVEHFARPLKEVASIAFNIPLGHFYERELKEVPHPIWEVSPRKIAQFVGTEMFRQKLGDLIGHEQSLEFWLKRLHGRLSGDLITDRDGEYTAGDTVIVPDVRFQNEYEWILNNGGKVIWISRPGFEGSVGIQSHQSEAGIYARQGEEANYLIANTGTLEDLYAQVDDFIKWTNWKLCPTKFDVSEF